MYKLGQKRFRRIKKKKVTKELTDWNPNIKTFSLGAEERGGKVLGLQA